MADYIFKVSTDEVRAKAQQIEAERANMEGIMTDLQSKITMLEEYWRSESGVNYTEKYQTLASNIKRSLDVMSKHITNLTTVAAHYDDTDTTQTQKTNRLSTGNIF